MPQPIQPQVVGFPTPDSIAVSKSDMVGIVNYVGAMHDWIEAASACLKAAQ